MSEFETENSVERTHNPLTPIDPLKPSDIKGVYPVNITRKVCLFLGKPGCGKSLLYRCLTLEGSGDPPLGLQLNAPENHHVIQLVGDTEISVWDTIGFTGVSAGEDKNVFEKLVTDIRKHDTFVSTLFIVFHAEKFTPQDEAIVQFIKKKLAPEVYPMIKIIITNCNEWNTEEVLKNVSEKFSFLGDLEDRVILVDMIDPRGLPEGPLREQCSENWNAYRGVLQHHIRLSECAIPVDDLVRHMGCSIL